MTVIDVPSDEDDAKISFSEAKAISQQRFYPADPKLEATSIQEQVNLADLRAKQVTPDPEPARQIIPKKNREVMSV